MPKSERGILGYRKVPGKEILFSFAPRKGNECASDEEDSDYQPSDDEEGLSRNKDRKSALGKSKEKKQRNVKQRKKQAKNKQKGEIMKRKRNMVIDSSQSESPSKRFQKEDASMPSKSGHQLWGQMLPIEILVRVFELGVRENGAVPFLCRVSRVCSLWREAASKPSLWHHIDLSFGWVKSIEQTLNILLENRVSRLKILNLSLCAKLTDKEIKLVVDKCPLLESINLTACIKLTSLSISLLSSGCQHLKAVDLSGLNIGAVAPAVLKQLVEQCGSRLEEFVIAKTQLRSFPMVLKALMTCCPNLKLLDLSNCKFSSDFLMIPIEEFQAGCPSLEVLRLTGSKVRANQVSRRLKEESLGFPKLKELSVAVNITTTLNISLGITDGLLLRLLKTSSKLKHLDLRGCTHITADVLQKLSLDNLEQLFISQCSVSKYEGIAVIVQKWMHSLIELDLSWNVFPGMSLDIAMKKLSSTPQKSNLRILNLSGTSITAQRVKSLLDGCPRLSCLDLSSCRGLPRGMKQQYEGERLANLKRNIDTIFDEESENT
ncbi:F-box/LRR-repeat protein 6-like [Anneissia japonica]|uniref:F-box/LRR-repeat protein 6-like n=1 Tax=Anneissia japonica TaxID=1529436 RepID=UPI0014257C2F|nr:F-box/LRR-repeat protein 6-like [Anneissia japonica]XP_033105119.1 F-box/LRR-repeat protein 6-like [Anneissia japonica]